MASAAVALTPVDASVVVNKLSLPPGRAPCSPRHCLPMTKKGQISTKIRSPACVPPSSPRSMIAVAAAVIIATSSPVAVNDGSSPLSVLHEVFQDQPPPKPKAKVKDLTRMIGFVPKTKFIRFMRPYISDTEVE